MINIAALMLYLRGRREPNVSELTSTRLLWLVLSQLRHAPNDVELELLWWDRDALRVQVLIAAEQVITTIGAHTVLLRGDKVLLERAEFLMTTLISSLANNELVISTLVLQFGLWRQLRISLLTDLLDGRLGTN